MSTSIRSSAVAQTYVRRSRFAFHIYEAIALGHHAANIPAADMRSLTLHYRGNLLPGVDSRHEVRLRAHRLREEELGLVASYYQTGGVVRHVRDVLLVLREGLLVRRVGKRFQDELGRATVAIGVAGVAREVRLVVAEGTDGLLLLVDMIELATVDLAVLVGGAWHGRGGSCGHGRRADKLLRKDERVRAAGTKRLEVLATVGQDVRSVTTWVGGLPSAYAVLLVLHAFLDCSRLSLSVFDDSLVDGRHLLLRWKTSS